MLQLPDFQIKDSKNNFSCLKWTTQNGRRTFCLKYQTDIVELNFLVYHYRNNIHLTDSEVELKMTEYEKLRSERVYLLSSVDVFSRRCIVLDKGTVPRKNTFVTKRCLLSNEHFLFYPGLFLAFKQISARKSCFKCMFLLGSRRPLREMDPKYKFGGTIGYGDSCVAFFFCHFKVFRLHAVLQEFGGAVREHSGNGLGYSYKIGRRQNSCLLSHLNELLVCLQLKLILLSVFNSLDFWSILSCCEPNIKLGDRNDIKELEFLFSGKFSNTRFVLQIDVNPQNKLFGVQNIAWNCVKQGFFSITMSSKTHY